MTLPACSIAQRVARYCCYYVVMMMIVRQLRLFLLVTNRGMTATSMPDNRSSSKSSRINGKPIFFFHIGIPKSGTTTLQCGLSNLAKRLASEASLYFLGKSCGGIDLLQQNNETALRPHYLQFNLKSKEGTGYAMTELQNRLQYHYSLHGHSTLLSVEAMAAAMVGEPPEIWHRLLNISQDWHTRILIGYRHFFEWLPSVYFQAHQNGANKNWLKSRPSLIDYMHQHQLVHGVEWETAVQQSNATFVAAEVHPTIAAFRDYSKYFDDVQIFDIHQSGDLTQNFVCEMLSPVTDRFCQKDSNAEVLLHQSGAERQSFFLDAERLTEAAFQKGYFSNQPNKANTIKAISTKLLDSSSPSFSNFTTHPYYRVCLSTVGERRLYNMSWSLYQDIRHDPAFHSHTQEESSTKEAFDQLFETARAKQKFCEIDTDRVLADVVFRSYLETLNTI